MKNKNSVSKKNAWLMNILVRDIKYPQDYFHRLNCFLSNKLRQASQYKQCKQAQEKSNGRLSSTCQSLASWNPWQMQIPMKSLLYFVRLSAQGNGKYIHPNGRADLTSSSLADCVLNVLINFYLFLYLFISTTSRESQEMELSRLMAWTEIWTENT